MLGRPGLAGKQRLTGKPGGHMPISRFYPRTRVVLCTDSIEGRAL